MPTTQTDKLTQSQLEQYLAKAAWILKGPVDASDFKVYIFPLLFFMTHRMATFWVCTRWAVPRRWARA